MTGFLEIHFLKDHSKDLKMQEFFQVYMEQK